MVNDWELARYIDEAKAIQSRNGMDQVDVRVLLYVMLTDKLDELQNDVRRVADRVDELRMHLGARDR